MTRTRSRVNSQVGIIIIRSWRMCFSSRLRIQNTGVRVILVWFRAEKWHGCSVTHGIWIGLILTFVFGHFDVSTDSVDNIDRIVCSSEDLHRVVRSRRLPDRLLVMEIALTIPIEQICWERITRRSVAGQEKILLFSFLILNNNGRSSQINDHLRCIVWSAIRIWCCGIVIFAVQIIIKETSETLISTILIHSRLCMVCAWRFPHHTRWDRTTKEHQSKYEICKIAKSALRFWIAEAAGDAIIYSDRALKQ